MRKLIIYDHSKNKTYQYPNGNLATPERILADYPAITTFPHIIETDESEQMIISIQNLSMARSMYNIDSSLSDEEAALAIQEALNTVPDSTETVSAEERIAAALEYQIMASLPDTM